MKNNLKISPLQNKDIKPVVALVNSAYRGEASKKGWTTEADLLEGNLRTDEKELQSLLKKPGSLILTCKNSMDELVGCMYLQREEEQLYLGMLTVSPNEQAQGIGKQLLLAAENHAKELHCNSIVMTVISLRHSLIEWYKRNGYKPTGETKPFPDNPKYGKATQPLEFIVLKKNLSE